MDQFDRMKEKHPDALLLFRTGNTYEIYRQDAKKVSEILGTPVSTRTVGKEKNVDVASFPHQALDTYLPRLVRAGMRVAICEQLEDPKQKKKEKPPYPLSATTRGLTACRITMAPSSTSHRMALPAPNSCRSRRCARGSSTSSRRARRMGLAP